MQKFPPESMSSPVDSLSSSTLVVAEINRRVGAECKLTSKEAADEMEESSSRCGIVSSTVTTPSLNNSGKSWNVLGEKGTSQKSITDPGGGGPRLL
jgi:hypothetical protein